jgi:hypothetical protein
VYLDGVCVTEDCVEANDMAGYVVVLRRTVGADGRKRRASLGPGGEVVRDRLRGRVQYRVRA